MLVSIVIPVLNEAQYMGVTAARLKRLRGTYETLVVDGGSTDGTVAQAKANGLSVIAAPRGRGPQMNVGAAATNGDVLLFLHADTSLPADALQLIEAALQSAEVCGGNFQLHFSGHSFSSKLLAGLYPLLRGIGLVYGDSAMFVRRSVFQSVGGYREIPLFEDCDLYRRLRRVGRFVRLSGVAITSPRRFEGRFLRVFGLWALLQVLYWIGIAPHTLARWYHMIR